MSSSRLLDFFMLEASDYIDRMDSVISEAEGARPDTELLTAQARLLRGSATMARQLPIADLASALERIGRAVRDDILEWTPQLHSAVVAAVDDLRILVRAVRSWGGGDDRRTETRIAELVALYPQAGRNMPTPPATTRSTSFIASETAQLASALDTLLSHPSSGEALAVALHRLSSLRGVATINDLPLLPGVLKALDDLIRPIHAAHATPETPHLSVLNASVKLLRRFSHEMAVGGDLASNADLAEFHAAVGLAAAASEGSTDPVVPISRLNFDDGLPHLVSPATDPPQSAEARFRLEVAGPAEHLRHQIAVIRGTSDDRIRKLAAAEISAVLRSLRATADEFDHPDIAHFIDVVRPDVPKLGTHTVGLVDELSRTLTEAALTHSEVKVRLGSLLEAREGALAATAAAEIQTRASPPLPEENTTSHPAAAPVATADPPPASVSAPLAAVPVVAPAHRVAAPVEAALREPTAAPPEVQPLAADPPPPARRVSTGGPLRGAALLDALDSSIAGLESLPGEPRIDGDSGSEGDVIPIQELLYSGQDAIARAREIRDTIRARDSQPAREELEEIFELLDLATAE